MAPHEPCSFGRRFPGLEDISPLNRGRVQERVRPLSHRWDQLSVKQTRGLPCTALSFSSCQGEKKDVPCEAVELGLQYNVGL